MLGAANHHGISHYLESGHHVCYVTL